MPLIISPETELTRRAFLGLCLIGVGLSLVSCESEGKNEYEKLMSIDQANNLLVFQKDGYREFDIFPDAIQRLNYLSEDLVGNPLDRFIAKGVHLEQIDVMPEEMEVEAGIGMGLRGDRVETQGRIFQTMSGMRGTYNDIVFEAPTISELRILLRKNTYNDLELSIILAKELHSISITEEDVNILWSICFPEISFQNGLESTEAEFKIGFLLNILKSNPETIEETETKNRVVLAHDALGYIRTLPFVYYMKMNFFNDIPNLLQRSVYKDMLEQSEVTNLIDSSTFDWLSSSYIDIFQAISGSLNAIVQGQKLR